MSALCNNRTVGREDTTQAGAADIAQTRNCHTACPHVIRTKETLSVKLVEVLAVATPMWETTAYQLAFTAQATCKLCLPGNFSCTQEATPPHTIWCAARYTRPRISDLE
jgi:hypothetical protein